MARLLDDPCPNCGSIQGIKRIFEAAVVNGIKMTVVYCDVCAAQEKTRQPQNFPAIKRKRGRPRKDESLHRNDEKFGKFQLSESEIAANRSAQRSGLGPKNDTPEKRRFDDMEFKRVFIGADKGGMRKRPQRIMDVLNDQYGHEDWEIVRDNGFEVTAQRRK